MTSAIPSRAPAGHAMVLICKKCGKKMDGNPVKDLSRMFKAKGKELYGGKGIRVCTVSCMKLCPKKAVAVALVPLKKFASGTQFYCVAPDTFGAFVEESFGSTLA